MAALRGREKRKEKGEGLVGCLITLFRRARRLRKELSDPRDACDSEGLEKKRKEEKNEKETDAVRDVHTYPERIKDSSVCKPDRVDLR